MELVSSYVRGWTPSTPWLQDLLPSPMEVRRRSAGPKACAPLRISQLASLSYQSSGREGPPVDTSTGLPPIGGGLTNPHPESILVWLNRS
jgi:hypothetical protein